MRYCGCYRHTLVLPVITYLVRQGLSNILWSENVRHKNAHTGQTCYNIKHSLVYCQHHFYYYYILHTVNNHAFINAG